MGEVYELMSERVTAVQFNNPGDHPRVKYDFYWNFHSDGEKSGWYLVGANFDVAAFVDLGDWIITHGDGQETALSDESFRHTYRKVLE